MSQPPSGICAIVLAAGESKRFQAGNKLLAEIDGISLVERVVDAVVGSGVDRTYVVTGHQPDRIMSRLSNYTVTRIHNPRWQEGMGSSLACAAQRLANAPYQGILVCLADLPRLASHIVATVVQAFFQSDCQRIAVPEHEGKLGHPVIFPIRFREQLAALTGDQGARHLLQSEKRSLIKVPQASSAIRSDIDTLEDLIW